MSVSVEKFPICAKRQPGQYCPDHRFDRPCHFDRDRLLKKMLQTVVVRVTALKSLLMDIERSCPWTKCT
jgi:hypothetical protein